MESIRKYTVVAPFSMSMYSIPSSPNSFYKSTQVNHNYNYNKGTFKTPLLASAQTLENAKMVPRV